MIEIPEAVVISKQLDDVLNGKIISDAIIGDSPHKFMMHSGNPEEYTGKLIGRGILGSYNHASRVFVETDSGSVLIFGEGTRILYHERDTKCPLKHQLKLIFTDGTFLTVSIQMYGFILLEDKDTIKNSYILISIEKPSPLCDGFDFNYFSSLLEDQKDSKLTAKAFLATDQRIPGLGNGVLHDILFNAGIHHKLRVSDFNEEDRDNLFNSIKIILKEMTERGGRDTEKDIFGNYGGYDSVMSRKTVGRECPSCGEVIMKQSYLGGSIYFCPVCQRKE